MSRLLGVIVILFLSQIAYAAECTMKASPIDIRRISHNPTVKSFVVAEDKLSLSALLKNGSALKLSHMGCEHSGASASLWLDTDRPFTDSTGWSKEFIKFARIAFSAEIANDIVENLQSGKFKTTVSDSRVVISAAPQEYMNYSIVMSLTEHGVMLTITYSLG